MKETSRALRWYVCALAHGHAFVCVQTQPLTTAANKRGTLIYILYLSQVSLIASASLEVSAALLLE